jgi:hypothetical protein
MSTKLKPHVPSELEQVYQRYKAGEEFHHPLLTARTAAMFDERIKRERERA